MMTRNLQNFFTIGVTGLMAASGTIRAQGPEEPTPKRDAIESGISEIKNDASLDESARNDLIEPYQQALEALDNIAEFQKKTAQFQKIIETGAAETDVLREAFISLREQLESGDATGLTSEATQEPKLTLASEEAELAAQRAALNETIAAIASTNQRSEAIGERLSSIEQPLAEARERLAQLEPDDPASGAETTRLRAEMAQFQAQAEALRTELKALPIQQPLLTAQQNLLEAEMEQSTRRLKKLTDLITEQQLAGVKTAQDLIREIREKHAPIPSPLDELITQLETASRSLREVSESTQKTSSQQTHRERRLSSLRERFDTYRKLLELGNLEGEFAEMFLRELRRLPAQSELDTRVADLSESIALTRQKLYLLDDLQPAAIPTDRDPAIAADATALREMLEELKAELDRSYQRHIALLTKLEETEQVFAQTASEFRAYATTKLFWVRSSPAIRSDSFRSIPAGLAYCFSPNQWTQLGDILRATPLVLTLALGVALLVLLFGRPSIRRALAHSGQANLKISTARITNTLRAFGLTMLLALPVPLLLSTVLIGIEWLESSSAWGRGLRDACAFSIAFLFTTGFLIAACRSGGLGELHFKWSPTLLRRVRHSVWASSIIAIPCVLILSLIFTEKDSLFLGGLGRLTTLVFVLSHGLILARLLHRRHGLIAWIHERQPDSRPGRTQNIWPPVIYLLTAVITLLLLLGYIITAVMLVEQLGYVVLACIIAIFFYAFCVRWLSINERRLAFDRAVAERQARIEKAREAAKQESAETPEPTGDESLISETIEEEAFDLSLINEHSRRLLGFVTGVSILTALYLIWTGFGPVTGAFNQFTLMGNITLSDVFLTLVVITLTVSTVRNLPGLLEGLVFNKLSLTSGGRHTATTLVQYIITAIGACVLFQNLGIDWSKFAWIAAALSVGIGFGLQEVVANFISGLILLFERPIRVGDVVTVDGVDGIVTKIQIRATTITGWNRKEFIVPNKNFVTGTLLNWTLTNPINRVEINVGVAYGSDTQKAIDLLIETANEHPTILDDPAPLASFDQFGDSTLNLTLRAYIPNMENRVSIISQLHTAIDQKFKAANIEIAFPQLDMHMKK